MSYSEFLQAFAVSKGMDGAEQLMAGSHHSKYSYVTKSREVAMPLVESLAARLPSGLDGARVLHVGAGYGGLAIELAKRGALVIGIETADPKRALAEIHAKGEAEVRFVKSYLSVRSHMEAMREEGPFDVVIVHELFRRTYDTLGLLNDLKSLLVPEGLLSYRITNFFTPQMVLSDPVRKKLGLVLLPPDKIFDYVGDNYGFYFRPQAYYDALLESVGFSDPQLLHRNTDASHDGTRKAIDGDVRRIRNGLKEENFEDPKIFAVVRAACREYLDRLTADARTLSWNALFEKYRAAQWEGIRTL